jgi:hypothetical protein
MIGIVKTGMSGDELGNTFWVAPPRQLPNEKEIRAREKEEL